MEKQSCGTCKNLVKLIVPIESLVHSFTTKLYNLVPKSKSEYSFIFCLMYFSRCVRKNP